MPCKVEKCVTCRILTDNMTSVNFSYLFTYRSLKRSLLTEIICKKPRKQSMSESLSRLGEALFHVEFMINRNSKTRKVQLKALKPTSIIHYTCRIPQSHETANYHNSGVLSSAAFFFQPKLLNAELMKYFHLQL